MLAVTGATVRSRHTLTLILEYDVLRMGSYICSWISFNRHTIGLNEIRDERLIMYHMYVSWDLRASGLSSSTGWTGTLLPAAPLPYSATRYRRMRAVEITSYMCSY